MIRILRGRSSFVLNKEGVYCPIYAHILEYGPFSFQKDEEWILQKKRCISEISMQMHLSISYHEFFMKWRLFKFLYILS